MGHRYGLEVNVKEPEVLRQDPGYEEIRIDKWQVSVTTVPEKRDMPKQRIKIEVANIPAYTRIPNTLKRNFLPQRRMTEPWVGPSFQDTWFIR